VVDNEFLNIVCCSEEKSSDDRHKSSRSRHDDLTSTDTQVLLAAFHVIVRRDDMI